MTEANTTPGFHMRRRDREITDAEKLKEILKKSTVCHLGLADGGEPYVVPVNFGYDNGCIYFHSAQSGHKIDLLKKNPRVCFEVDTDLQILKTEKNNCQVNYRSLIGRGKAVFLENAEEKARALKVIMRQCAGFEYDIPSYLDRTAVVRIEIESLTGKQAGY